MEAGVEVGQAVVEQEVVDLVGEQEVADRVVEQEVLRCHSSLRLHRQLSIGRGT
jgi:hypothetical protein